uniref:RecA-like N-terminal domain-containing protein n=1 Tax=Lactuca sativa TaxID=4236 RepID=A0A9R1VT65_LACSA|nr:hypothetical protein LSAT_V11C400210720 [Lactuca sativa]
MLVENALDPLLLETVGVNTKSLLISQPNSAKNLLSIVGTLTQNGAVDVIAIDSVAALIPQCEITDTLIIFINQGPHLLAPTGSNLERHGKEGTVFAG